MRKNRTTYKKIAWKNLRAGQSRLHYYTGGWLTLCGVEIPLKREFIYDGVLCRRCLFIASGIYENSVGH